MKWIYLPLLLLLFPFGFASASISRNAVLNPTSSTSPSFTVSATTTQNVLVVFTTERDGKTVTGVTYNSVALTALDTADLGVSSYKTRSWYLKNPATGTNTISVSSTGSGDIMTSAISYSGVDQTIVIDTHSGFNGSGSPITTTLTASTASSTMLLSGSNLDGNFSASTGSTLETSASDRSPIFSKSDISSGSNSMTVTFSGTRQWGMTALILLPYTGSGGGGISTSTATSTLSADGATVSFLLVILILLMFLMVVGFMYNSFSNKKPWQ